MPAKIKLDINLLKKYFCEENKTLTEIGNLMGCYRNAVAREVKENNLTRWYEDPLWLKQKHHVEKITLTEMAKLAHCSHESIRTNLRKNNLETLDEVKYKSVTKYKLNKHYFENINSHEKAYWLGHIIADGCIVHEGYQTYRLNYTIAKKDKKHLEKFQKSINSNAPIEERITYLKKTGKSYHGAQLRINNSYLCKTLIKLGVLPNKSCNETLPKIEKKYYKDFILGVFDGDGSFSYWFNKKRKRYYCQTTIVGSQSLMQSISKIIKDNLNFDVNLRQSGKLHVISINDKNAEILMHWLYKDSVINLDRKYKKFQEWLNFKQKIIF